MVPLEAFVAQHTGTKFSADLFYQRLMSFPKRRPAKTVVQIEKPEDANLADWFAELRSWFDVNDCSPLLFAKAGTVMNRDRFNIKFSDDVQAHLFTSSFAKYGPSIRSIGGEQTGVRRSSDLTDPPVDPDMAKMF